MDEFYEYSCTYGIWESCFMMCKLQKSSIHGCIQLSYHFLKKSSKRKRRRAAYGLQKGDHAFRHWLRRENILVKLLDKASALLLDFVKAHDGIVEPEDCKLLHYYEEAVKIEARVYLFPVETTLESRTKDANMQALKKQDFLLRAGQRILYSWEREHCPWWIDMSPGHLLEREKELHKAMHGARVDPPPSTGNDHQEALMQKRCSILRGSDPLASHYGSIDVTRHDSSFAKIMDDIAPTFGLGGQRFLGDHFALHMHRRYQWLNLALVQLRLELCFNS
ncbi:hypothetical protein GOP47_0023957 [Adiantum capillus-veneris]|uniref:Uncharacterized protein n=1 Tax=Adiantum capillus-veneris TaxID=13818 RepID=A0A9D4U5M0_ADICA|nr:hypothetical protein GOP47_0023957 [Adiantum capillus-veneris]